MSGIDPEALCEIEDFSTATLQAQIERLLASGTAEHLIYRECELDEIWRLLDLEVASLSATSTANPDLPRLQAWRTSVMRAHDLVGVEGDPVRAAACLRELIS